MSQSRRSKEEILQDIKGVYDTKHYLLMAELLSCMIMGERVHNDTATGNDVIKNQGAIRGHYEIARNLNITLEDV